MTGFNEFCRQTIADNLPEYVGTTVYMCNLGDILTETMNNDRTFTYNSKVSMDYLLDWWDNAAEYWDYEKQNFGEHCHNPFNNPEAYTICMVIEGVRSLLSQCKEADEAWDNEVELTQEIMNSILNQIESLEVEW